MTANETAIIVDTQTNSGLLIAVAKENTAEVITILKEYGLENL